MVVIQPLSTCSIKPNICFDLSNRRSTTVSLETRNPILRALGNVQLARDNISKESTTCTPVCSSSSSSESGAKSEDEPEIANECMSVTNKTGVLGKLTNSDCDIINSPSSWLDCNTIEQAQVLLKEQNPLIDQLNVQL